MLKLNRTFHNLPLFDALTKVVLIKFHMNLTLKKIEIISAGEDHMILLVSQLPVLSVSPIFKNRWIDQSLHTPTGNSDSKVRYQRHTSMATTSVGLIMFPTMNILCNTMRLQNMTG